MRARAAVVVAVVMVLVALAPPASAKGPTGGVLEGEGLDAPIVVGGGATTAGGRAMAETVGLFHAALPTEPDPMLDAAPTTRLGPELTLRWAVPGPEGRSEVVQLLYPYADGGPLVFTAPGQALFGSERTRGGWYRAPASLPGTLQELGLPAEAALTDEGGGLGAWVPIGASLAAMAGVLLCTVLLSRRRGGLAPVPS